MEREGSIGLSCSAAIGTRCSWLLECSTIQSSINPITFQNLYLRLVLLRHCPTRESGLSLPLWARILLASFTSAAAISTSFENLAFDSVPSLLRLLSVLPRNTRSPQHRVRLDQQSKPRLSSCKLTLPVSMSSPSAATRAVTLSRALRSLHFSPVH